MMPKRLVAYRHGYSYGNWANDLIRADRYEEIPAEFHGVPIWLLRLADLGVQQAKTGAEWLDRLIGLHNFTAGFVSPFIRAIETASWVDVPFIWKINSFIRERNWGDMDRIPYPWEYERYREAKYNKGLLDALSWQPPNGEPIMDMPDRCYHFFDTLHREHSEGTVLCAMHGESIIGLKMAIERIPPAIANQMIAEKSPILKIPNCGITEYTRVNPYDPDEPAAYHLTWAREIDPMNPPSDPMSCWRTIERPRLDMNALKEMVAAYGIGLPVVVH